MSHYDNSSRSQRSNRRSQLHADSVESKLSRRKPWIVVTSLVAVVALVGAVVLGLFTSGVFATDDYSGEGTGEVQFTISQGEYGDAIAINLQSADVIKSSKKFYSLLLSTKPEPVFVPGIYRLKQHMSNAAVITALQDSSNRIENALVIPEGYTQKQIFTLISSKLSIPVTDLQSAAANPQSFGLPTEAKTLEGFLYPATYKFSPGVTATDVLKTLTAQSLNALDKAGVAKADRWKTIIMASIIERESSSVPGDAAKVSRVFFNRIAIGEKLGSDVTACYGAGLVGRDCILITQAALDDKSNPYNTRVNTGLPMGPISNPGAVAINAAQNPAVGDWLFFCTVNLKTGETVFSTTNAEHEKAKAQFEQWLSDNPNAF